MAKLIALLLLGGLAGWGMMQLRTRRRGEPGPPARPRPLLIPLLALGLALLAIFLTGYGLHLRQR